MLDPGAARRGGPKSFLSIAGTSDPVSSCLSGLESCSISVTEGDRAVQKISEVYSSRKVSPMHSIIYLVGLVVVVLFILSFVGLA
jgi:hypothetical protein